MNDVKLFLDASLDQGISIKVENGDLAADDGLETAVLISLYSDRRITPDQLPVGQKSLRGWWGDVFSEVDQDLTGSRFWLLTREKRLNQTLRKFEDYAKEALAWMIEDGVAEAITAQASYEAITKFLILEIAIQRPLGENFKYKLNWDKQLSVRS